MHVVKGCCGEVCTCDLCHFNVANVLLRRVDAAGIQALNVNMWLLRGVCIRGMRSFEASPSASGKGRHKAAGG
jgi:hypothetical protein